MRILADTHLILWALVGDDRLSVRARNMMLDHKNELYCSVASIWEVAIKHMVKPDKIMMSGTEFSKKARNIGFRILQINSNHVETLETIKRSQNALPHKDPFDRMLIAQAKAEDMLFMTHDSILSYYMIDSIILV